MQSAVYLLEEERRRLMVSQKGFIQMLGVPRPSSTRYNQVVAGRHSVPLIWRPKVADFLKVSGDELDWSIKDWRAGGGETDARSIGHRFSAEELRGFADIAERLGQPLTIDTLARIAAEIKAAAQK